MAITEIYTMSAVSISSTEISIVSGTSTLQNITTDGVYQLFVDPVAAGMAKGDVFTIRVYEKTLSGSTKRVVFTASLQGAQSEVLVVPPLVLIHGWDMTIQKNAGTDRSFDASIRQLS